VLRTAARRLQERCRVIDTLARYGGEEFVILMPETALEAAVSACERLRIAVSQAPIDVDGRNFEITVSVGIAQWARGAESIEGLIDRADRALYGAKQRGRNRTELAPA
jgi:diguanylate cyclase (GGDEF)-like protein